MIITNEIRSAWARDALAAFAECTGQNASGDLEHDKETVVCDLLCDLRHLCDEEGVDWNNCLRRGMDHYESEIDPENEGL